MINAIVPTSPQQLLVDQDTAADATAKGIMALAGQCSHITIVLQSTGTTSGGTIQIEEAYYTPLDGTPYTGTWSPIGSAINASSFTGGAQQFVHIIGFSSWAVRVRIATDITGGGTISAWAWGN